MNRSLHSHSYKRYSFGMLCVSVYTMLYLPTLRYLYSKKYSLESLSIPASRLAVTEVSYECLTHRVKSLAHLLPQKQSTSNLVLPVVALDGDRLTIDLFFTCTITLAFKKKLQPTSIKSLEEVEEENQKQNQAESPLY